MEKIEKYQAAIMEVMNSYACEREVSAEGLEFETIADIPHNRYQLVLMGWQDGERIYHLLFHLDIINGKIWIQEDATETGIANLLVEKGIAKKDIILAYYSEYHRQFTDFAVS